MSPVSIREAELCTESHGAGDVVLLVAGRVGSGRLLSWQFLVVLHDHRGVARRR